jgi:hypothetical protein
MKVFYVPEAYLTFLEGEDQWKRWALKIETFLGPEMATSKTHVHKIISVPVLSMALGLNDFESGKYITRAIRKGGP